ncbi:SRPBCC family protein [Streptomyces olivaceoviridis]|uniref:SRPBCC family protein n=1 Tax=Streptomyces olivaceoviridis TaxID=1921 RepID=UPI0033B9F530
MARRTVHRTEESTRIAAGAEVVRAFIEDVEGWSHLHPTAVHAEYVERKGTESLIRQWALVDERSVRHWLMRRWDKDDTIAFAHEPAAPPFAEVRGAWTFESVDGGAAVVVRMEHEFALLEEEAAAADRQREKLRQGSLAYLKTLKHAAENREDIRRRTLTFEDPLFIAGSVQDAYAYLLEADKWPQRMPHVAALTLEEPGPGVQFFDMDTSDPDGGHRHSTRSVRICLSPRLIVYKQIKLPVLLTAHTGHWSFTETPEGVIATTRHTATVKEAALGVLGEGTTVQDARNYLRRVLTDNSMSNLRLTKEYAEGRAGR